MSRFVFPSKVHPVLLIVLAFYLSSVHAATFRVTSIADAGTGTLRQAIADANGTAGADTIIFNIGGTGPHNILPSTALPPVSDRLVIDGYSQPSSAPSTTTMGTNAVIQIQIDGSLASPTDDGLTATADSCVIRGLAIINFRNGIDLNSSGNTVSGCFIGISTSGSSAPGNTQSGLFIFEGSYNLIGGNTPAARNLISGNIGAAGGILMGGPNCKGNRVEGNYIGTDRTGTLARGNSFGITISNSTESNFIGGTTSGAGNLISGNDQIGLVLLSQSYSNRVYGNWIGLTSSGTGLRPNGTTGIDIDNSGSNLIGSGTAAGRNVVAGSPTNIAFVGDSARHNQVIGNYIGTDTSGTRVLVGQDVGIKIDADSNYVGGPASGQENVVGGHTFYGIWINGPSIANIIRNNRVGIGADLSTPIPNGTGIFMLGVRSDNNQMGGKNSGDGNAIWYNTQSGILLEGGVANAILSNSIGANGGLGIDLWPLGVNPNDVGDAETGPNDLQNFPVLTTATDSSGMTLIRGSLNSQPLQNYYIQLFSNTVCDPSGFGAGAELVDSFTLAVGLSGTATISRTLSPGVSPGTFLTATATDAAGSTSEFSNCATVITGIYTTQVTTDTADIFFLQRADLDRDNNMDFVFTGNTKDSLYIAYGKSDGTIEAPRAYFRIKQAAVYVDYLNQDNLLDIIARTATKLYILQNLGNRQFSIDSQFLAQDFSGRLPSAGVNPSVSSGIFNADVHLDIVATPNLILFGDGAGGFPSSASLPFSFDAVAAADFNGDGFDDLAAVVGDSIVIYQNNGAGAFARTGAASITAHAHDIASVRSRVDLNGDGRPDVVAISGKLSGISDTSSLFIGLSDGLGGFLGTQIIDIFGTALNFAISDVDKDNDLDISIVNADSSTLVVYLNNAGLFLQTASTAIPAGVSAATALATADLNRDGSPDALFGGENGTPIVLAINQSPSDPVLKNEMVTTGYDNAMLSITNPKGLQISPTLSSVAGSAYWRYDINGNAFIDDRAFDYNLQYGEYRIVVRPSPNAPIGTPVSMAIGIDGSQQAIAVRDYDWSNVNQAATLGSQTSTDSLVLYYPVEPDSPIEPEYGKACGEIQPTLSWPGLAAPLATYQIQLDPYYDFRAPRFDVSGLSPSKFTVPNPLGKDSVYYWRVKKIGDAAFSHPFALYIAPDACCKGLTGNIDCDPNDAVDISDLSTLIDFLYISFTPLCCRYEANVDGSPDGSIDISDLSALIDYLYISFTPPAVCQ